MMCPMARIVPVKGKHPICILGSAQRLLFHSGDCSQQKASKNASSDTRLAGRQRFYKHVGVKSVSEPWQESDASAQTTVNSPISAGVDGTQSASGVSNDLSLLTADQRKDMLLPRLAGSRTPMSSSSEHGNWYGVTLDGRVLKTPLGQTLAVPSELLAWAIAAEWDAQEKLLQPAQMPLMTLTCTTLDQTASRPDVARRQALRYLPTDTTCYYADAMDDRVLHRRQQQAWEGLHDYCQHVLGGDRPAVAMGASEALLMSRARSAKPSSGLPHPPRLVEAATAWTESLDAWHLTALHSVAAEAKSFLVAMAVVSSHHHHHDDGDIDSSTEETDLEINNKTNDDKKAGAARSPFREVHKAAEAARVEEEFQIETWGLVEGGHDYDRLNCSVQMHAAHFLVSSITHDVRRRDAPATAA